MKKLLNILLLISFVITVMAPLTGITVHKLASVVFLLLCLIHTGIYWKKMNGKRWLVLAMVLMAFLSGIFGMIFDQIPLVLAAHKALSIALTFFLAIHIFVYHKRMPLGLIKTSGSTRGR